MYRYAVSYVNQTHSSALDNIVQAKKSNDANNIQASASGSGEVYASDLRAARVNANEKFVDKTIQNIMKEKNSSAFYA